ncbi:TIGR01777 family oxidoreductase [Chryseolinea lacunae]|uniref:TIGR01777 family oxidoreductase n=1 Tax=Chryseolinea lacunae TaxID=2801331 RepID=A0ABS1L0I2_9BACT|nr:TIGR01777 family oxidoreductase [Chryseolinea lacunae]MBL0745028.1 TIGR01777 family oxidoreductase [Chryseolinea lacunae]
MNKVILAGGSGFLGSVLARYFATRAKHVVIFSRKPQPAVGNINTVQWDAKQLNNTWVRELEGADLLINLTGKNVNCRYTEANKKEILESRLDSTNVLGLALQQLQQPPRVWIQSASATYYRHAEDRPMDETTGEAGEGFSVDVCKAWEKTFADQIAPRTRKVLLRVGIVLGMGDGAFPRMLNLVRAGLGGRQGDGHQLISWIHEKDVAQIMHWLYQHETLDGMFNVTAPQPVTNAVFMDTLRRICKMPFGLPSPGWLLKLGAGVIGTETELILKSRWVIPKRLQQEGYMFAFPTLEGALKDIVG